MRAKLKQNKTKHSKPEEPCSQHNVYAVGSMMGECIVLYGEQKK